MTWLGISMTFIPHINEQVFECEYSVTRFRIWITRYVLDAIILYIKSHNRILNRMPYDVSTFISDQWIILLSGIWFCIRIDRKKRKPYYQNSIFPKNILVDVHIANRNMH